MAIYHVHAKVHSRSKGASAVARAAYRAREKLIDERTGERHDYSKRTDLDHAEILAPKDAPEWARDRSRLWNQVEAAERRKDAQVARELQIALPVELSPEQRRQLVREFVQDECVSRGMVADVAIHGAETRNPHAHVLLTTRRIGPDGFGAKDRSWNDRKLLQTWRVEWGGYANIRLDMAGRPERIDHRTLAAQRDDALDRGDVEAANRLDRAPDIHLGQAAGMEARGQATERGERSREIAAANGRMSQEREAVERNVAVIDREIQREQLRGGSEGAGAKPPPLPRPSEWKGVEPEVWAEARAGAWSYVTYERMGDGLEGRQKTEWAELRQRQKSERAELERESRTRVGRIRIAWGGPKRGGRRGLRAAARGDRDTVGRWFRDLERRQASERAALEKAHAELTRQADRQMRRDYAAEASRLVPDVVHHRANERRLEQERAWERERRLSPRRTPTRGPDRDSGPSR